MAKYRDPRVSMAPAYRATKRQLRRPQHPFYLKTRPFQIQPFVIAPVLPGETLTHALIESNVVTDPLATGPGLIGWWTEYFLFYVKLRDLDFHNDPTGVSKPYEQMVINPTAGGAALHDAASATEYHTYGINFARDCLACVTEWYFRDQGEAWNVATLDNLPMGQITGKSWMNSVTRAADKRTNRDVNVDRDGDGTVEAQELLEAMEFWESIREAGVEDMDYEDYLRTFGTEMEGQKDVSISPNLFKPELLRYSRNWTLPVNVVEPTTGVPVSAARWVCKWSADRARFFKEPGFLFGVTISRPKVYVKDQDGALVGSMDKMEYWLPALLHNNYEKAFRSFGVSEGPLAGEFTTPDTTYHVDMRDLLIHGDQFVNFDPTTVKNAVAVINATGSDRYPLASADIDAFFAAPASNKIHQDGVCHFQIKGRQRDRTPTGVPL